MQPRISHEQFGGAGWQNMVALRRSVLRAPLGLEFSDEQLRAEAVDIHVGIWLETILAGTLLLLPPDSAGEGKLRQMAIRPDCERRGLGRMLVQHGEAVLRRLGAVSVRLSARETAVGFYERLGFIAEGGSFIEVTVPHRLMRKRLNQVQG